MSPGHNRDFFTKVEWVIVRFTMIALLAIAAYQLIEFKIVGTGHVCDCTHCVKH